MAIQPEERQENVKSALFDYIETNYTTTSKWFQGSNVLDTTAISEWVWFGIVGSSRRFVRQVGTNMGDLVTFLVQAVIYVKPTETIVRIDRLRDIVVNLLRRVAIQVVDRVGSAGNLGKLYGQGLVGDVPLGIVDDVDQYSLTFAFSYLEEYSV